MTTRTPTKQAPPSDPPDAEAPAPELPPPTNVVEAIARVMAEIGGIKRLTPQQRQALGLTAGGGDGAGSVRYAYRGIDQLASAAQPLFGQYGIVLIPNVLSWEVRQVEVGGKPWDHMMVEVEYTVYGPNGSKLTSVVWGEGRDNSDKAMNKAMTVAFKNLLLRMLCIGDPQDDPDNERHETEASHYRDPNPANAEKSAATLLFEAVRDASRANPEIGPALKQWAADQGDGGKPLSQNAFLSDDVWREAVEAKLHGLLEAAKQDADATGEPAPEPDAAAEPAAEPAQEG